MAESLAITHAKILREISLFLGWGRDTSLLSSDQLADIAAMIAAGLRRFYFPSGHSWSFLTKTDSVSLASGASTANLPADFVDLVSAGFAYPLGSGDLRVVRVDETTIRELMAASDESGKPRYCAIRSSMVASGEPTQYEAVFYPKADAAYSLSYRYKLAPTSIDADSPTPLGGVQHGEAILEACLAAAEKTLNDVEGLHEGRFQRLLAVAIEQDQSLAQPSGDTAYPVAHLPAGLEVNKAYIRRRVGQVRGFGVNPGLWSHAEHQEVERAIEAGLRRFYAPQPTETGTHIWSFLSPGAEIATTAATAAYDLPLDFADMASEGFVVNVEGQATVARVSEHRLRAIQATEPRNGAPRYFAIRLKDGGESRYQAVFYPTPDAEYTLSYRYAVQAEGLADDTSLPKGLLHHLDTLIASCVAAAEPSEQNEAFYRSRLGQSLAADMRLSAGDDEVWQFEDKADDLSVNRAYLHRVVGKMLGHGAHPGLWRHADREEVDLAIQTGLRRFYFPMAEDGKPRHQWSFLTPTADLALESGVWQYPLPADFSDLGEDGFTFAAGSENLRVARVDEKTIRGLRSTANRTGVPQYCAVRRRAESGQSGYEAIFYPTPDAAHTLTYEYLIAPGGLDDQNLTPYGGVQHSETIVEACLAAAEKIRGDQDGAHEQRFRSLLQASLDMDRRLARPSEDGVWPMENEASDLSVNKAYLKRLVGRELGYGAHPGVWSHFQSQEVELAVQTGLRKFYNPPILPGERHGHEWSFLSPLGRMTTVSGQAEYDLPAEFAMFDGPLTYAPGTAALYPSIQIVGEHQIRHRMQRSETTARPEVAAWRPKVGDAVSGTRYELLLWPKPDGEYEINYRYRVNPAYLGEDTDLPFGGQPHGQTVVEACLAAADEQKGKSNGIHGRKFMECLAASVSHDRRVSSPSTLGYNHDRSDSTGEVSDWHGHDENVVTYNGVAY